MKSAAWRCAALLLSNPDMLILDEPTNHLDAESVAWLERFLQDFPGTVVAVTHDRYFLDNVAGWILELDRGHGIPWQGNYSSWLEQKEATPGPRREAPKRRARKPCRPNSNGCAAIPKAASPSQGAPASASRNVVAGLSETLETREIYIPPGPRLGDVVVEIEERSKSLRRQAAVSRPRIQAAAAAASSASSAPTAPARPRCSA